MLLLKSLHLDQFKYFLLREVRFGQDGDFSEEALIKRVNSDLANDYGNLSQRVLSFIHKNNNALTPAYTSFNKDDEVILNEINSINSNIKEYMINYQVTNALEELWIIIRKCNTYIDDQAPWSLKKIDLDRMNTVLYVLCTVIRKVSLIAQNFVPIGANKILDQLSIPENKRQYEHFYEELCPDTPLPKPEGVFPRLETKRGE